MAQRNIILTKEVAEKKLQRMALEIAEGLAGEQLPLVLIGIKGSGMAIAEKICNLLTSLTGTSPKVICCNINKKIPLEVSFSEEIAFNDKHIILVDDVTNSGRTFLYALKPLLDYLPTSIQTLSLVERMHKHFPIKIDYVGLSVATTLQEHIKVEVENGEVTGAWLE